MLKYADQNFIHIGSNERGRSSVGRARRSQCRGQGFNSPRLHIPMQSEDEIKQAQKVVRRGGIIAYPTEAVYGLGCDPLNRQSVARIARIKSRNQDKRFILIASSVAQLKMFCDVENQAFSERIGDTWPGPTTWIFPALDTCPHWLCDSAMTIAVRVSSHPTVIALCNQCNSALISTSANLSGKPPACSAEQVQSIFGNAVDYVVDGFVEGHTRPTRMLNVVDGQVVRQ